jgi:hypothetical protein
VTIVSDSPLPGLEEILGRLADVRRHEAGVKAMRGFLSAGVVLLAALVVILCLEALLPMPPVVRTVLVMCFLAGGAAALFRSVLLPLARRAGMLPGESDEGTAMRVGRAFPHIHDRLLNILQLLRKREQAGGYFSLELIDASARDLGADIKPLDFQSIIPHDDIRKRGMLFAVLVGLVLLLVYLFSGTLVGAAYRLAHFTRDFTLPPAVTFDVSPGNIDIVKGQDVDIIVKVRGMPPAPPVLLTTPDGQVVTEEHSLGAGLNGEYTATLAGVRLSTQYAVRSGIFASDEFRLRVIDRPVINVLRLQLNFPRYAALPSRELDENVGDATALRGTEIRFRVETSKDLATARLVFNDSSRIPLRVEGRNATGRITLAGERLYHIEVTDETGVMNGDPIHYTLRVIPDGFPAVIIAAPGTNVNVAGDEHLAMLFRLTDDYGMSRLRLGHKLVRSRYEQAATEYTFNEIPIPGRAGTELSVPFTWDLGTLRLTPEDVIQYQAEVYDNDNISGPKQGVSEVYFLRLPSLEEVFADVVKDHETGRETLTEAMRQAEEARKELEDLSRDLKKPQQRMSWDEQKKAEELVRKYDEIRKNMEEVQRTVDKMMASMQNNKMLSRETMQKYEELQQLMEQMNTPEFAEAMKKLQEAMQQMNPEAMKQALQQFSFSEEQFRKSIERTLNLLKRVQIEQKMDEMVKRVEEMKNAQEELRQRLEKQRPEDRRSADQVSREQKDLSDRMKALEKELRDLQKKMNEFPAEMPVKEMEQALDEMDKAALDRQMDEIAEQLREQMTDQALSGQRRAMESMSRMHQNLRQMKQSMMQNHQREVVQAMRRAAEDMLELSKRQEDLKNESRSLDPSSPRFRENAQEQMQVLRDLGNVTNGLSALSQKTFGITPEMGKSIGEAMRKMNDALQSLEQRNGTQAAQQQGGAMGALNQTAQQLQEAAQGMMQPGGQGGMGMAGFMQRLQQLGGMQQGINEGTRGLTPQQAAELSRLAGEQGMVRKSLEQLAREASNAGQLSKLLGDLSRVARDMREVQTDLAQGQVNPETLHKQERILSRMLDAQRSLRERDFEKRRKAESGRNLTRQGPADLGPAALQNRTRLQQDLLKALEEGYAKDYEDLIRKYFEALEQ